MNSSREHYKNWSVINGPKNITSPESHLLFRNSLGKLESYGSIICALVIQLEYLPSSGERSIEGGLRGDPFNMEDFSKIKEIEF